MTETPILQAVGLSKRFPGVNALDDVDLNVYPGEIHALLGENGAGKSTLLKTVFGVQQPDEGQLRWQGELVRFTRPLDALNIGIAMVHQELSLVHQLTAVQNVVLGREHTRVGVINWGEARRRAHASLAALGFDARSDIPVSSLSVAQQQIVELARALVVDARVIILDEPTASLTTQESDQLFTILRRLREEGRAIVYVSHRLKEVLDLSDRVTALRDGRLVGTRERAEIVDESDLIKMMVGRNLDALGVKGDAEPGEEILRVDHLSVAGTVRDVSLSLRRGEVVGLAGMVGAGRTEFARGVIGADKITSGSVYVRGEAIRIRRPSDAIKAGIALLPEDRKSQGLVLHMSAASNTTFIDPPLRHGLLDRRRQKQIASSALLPLNARISVQVPVKSLSGGTQQKVVLARWLLSNSDIFIFDEPTRGIDVGAKAEIHTLMRKLAGDGKAILMISSDLPEVLGMSDRVLVMRRGQIVAEFGRDKATEQAIVEHAAG